MNWWTEMLLADVIIIVVGVLFLWGVLWLIGKAIDMLISCMMGDGVGDATGEVHEWNPEREEREEK